MSHKKSKNIIYFTVAFSLVANIAYAAAIQCTGTCTAGIISKFIDSATIGNSVIVESGGLIGIGTSPSSGKLHISGGNIFLTNSDTWGVSMIVNNTSGGNSWRFVAGGATGDGNSPPGGMAIHHDGNNSPIQIKNDGTVFMNVGNVGIGTTNPTGLLHLRQSGGIQIKFEDIGGSGRTYSMGSGLGAAGVFNIQDTTAGGANRLTINSNGNIGIGTTGPNEKLQVSGAIVATGAATTAFANSATMDFFSGGMRLISRGTNATTNGTFNLLSESSNASQSNSRFYIDGSGNVGIGTNNPTGKLEVNGTLVLTPYNCGSGNPPGSSVNGAMWVCQ